MNQPEKKFNVRAFVALVIAICSVGLPITGIANHYHGFEGLTIARHAWMTAHNVLGILFIGFTIWHLALNRRALWRYIRGAGAQVPAVSREALLAGAVVAASLILFVSHAFHGRGH